MALYASAFLIGIITVLLVVFVAMYIVSRRAVVAQNTGAWTNRSTGAEGKDTMWSSHVGSLDDPARPVESEEIPAWKLHAEAARAGDPGIYKTRPSSPFTGERWGADGVSQATARRAKARRRKARAPRPRPTTGAFGRLGGEGDPYAVLG